MFLRVLTLMSCISFGTSASRYMDGYSLPVQVPNGACAEYRHKQNCEWLRRSISRCGGLIERGDILKSLLLALRLMTSSKPSSDDASLSSPKDKKKLGILRV
ncbi:hypothetical protein HPB50_009188 [Hyalomma asiaticum]|uniref:Uncharacterized protein n=1 Tax=Hyalomma asiaticum TaxID=266040 RepID=A0ACB7SDV1_HYAAI|nr:hypothetical protein HPB50_009188 [Hyalomma asiaticum]